MSKNKKTTETLVPPLPEGPIVVENLLLPPVDENGNTIPDPNAPNMDELLKAAADAAQSELFDAIDNPGGKKSKHVTKVAVADVPAITFTADDSEKALLKAELLAIKGSVGNLREGHIDPSEGKTGHGGIPAVQAFLNDYFSQTNCNRERTDKDPQAMRIDGKMATASEALKAYQREKIAQGRLAAGEDDIVLGTGTLALMKADGFDLAAGKQRAQEMIVAQTAANTLESQLVASEHAKEEAARLAAQKPIDDFKAILKIAKHQLTDGDRAKDGHKVRNDEDALKALAGTTENGPQPPSFKVLPAQPTRELMAFLTEKEKGGLTLEEIGQIKAEAASILASPEKLEEIRPAVMVAAVTKSKEPGAGR